MHEVKSRVPEKRVSVRYAPGKVREQQLKDALGQVGYYTVDA